MEHDEHPDWLLVLSLGGPVRVAEILGFPKEGGVQRVQNWKSRGIPSAVMLEHQRVFARARRSLNAANDEKKKESA